MLLLGLQPLWRDGLAVQRGRLIVGGPFFCGLPAELQRQDLSGLAAKEALSAAPDPLRGSVVAGNQFLLASNLFISASSSPRVIKAPGGRIISNIG